MKTSNIEQSSSSDPQPYGGHQHKGDPALEFIKHVCAVLALDQNVQHDILVKITSNMMFFTGFIQLRSAVVDSSSFCD